MNEKIDSLNNERSSNVKKIANLEEKIKNQKESIKNLIARNKEIEKDIEMQKGKIILQLLAKSNKSMEDLESFLISSDDIYSSCFDICERENNSDT